MVENAGKIVSQIVDSAPFKQNRFAPTTGLKIIPPNEFFSCPTDILILMLPGAYTEQVISTICQQISYNLEIYYFDDSPDIKRKL